MTNSLLLKMAIEIVDLPINSMVIFHSFLYVYQSPEGIPSKLARENRPPNIW